jgi:hypothetical protein
MLVSCAAVFLPGGAPAALPDRMGWAIALAIVLSGILGLIQVNDEAKKPYSSSILVPQTYFYLFIVVFGYVVSTLLAATMLAFIPPALAPFHFLFAVFFGVFGFEIVIKHTNITVFDNGVLTFQDWIKKAKTGAAGATIEKDVERNDIAAGKMAAKLSKVDEKSLNTFALHSIPASSGTNIIDDLDQRAAANRADPRLYKAYAVVTAVSRSKVEAFLRERPPIA